MDSGVEARGEAGPKAVAREGVKGFTVKDLKPASPPFFVRLFKIRIFESFMEMRPPIFGVI